MKHDGSHIFHIASGNVRMILLPNKILSLLKNSEHSANCSCAHIFLYFLDFC